MKRLLIPLLSLWCAALIPLGGARASPEGWWKEFYQCNGYVKKWAANWHTHSSSGLPYKHLMKSPTTQWPGMCTNCWVKHNQFSPWYQAWDSCIAPLQLQ